MVATLAVAALACLNAWAALPEEYQEVEYIESTGTQYINTGVVPGAMFGVTARLNTGTYKHESTFFGTDWNTYRYLFDQQSNNFYFHGNSTTICAVQSGVDCTVTVEPTTGENGTFIFAPNGGTPVEKSVSLKNSTSALKLFSSGASNRCASFRLYSFKLFKREIVDDGEGTVTTNDVTKLDLVPCEEKSTGVYGLYDFASDTFLTNAGTGVFLAGPHVFSSNTLEVRSRDAEAGTVDASVNGTYADGAVVTITATPAAGKRFFRWVGDIEKVADELSPETTVTMNGGADLTALFGGEITVAPTGGDYDNLNDAVAAANDYDTIVVKDGTYINKTAAFLAVTKPIAIVSENGKDVTFFRSEKNPSGGKINVNPAYKGMQVNHELAVVRGLTFYNFGADGIQNPQGLGVYLNAGLVEDCVISNVVPNHGGAAIHLTGGVARRMLLRDNKGGDQGSAGGAYLSGGTLADSVICNNTVPKDGGAIQANGPFAVVRNCQIFSNSASGNGGGVYLQSGLVSDCVITNNTGMGGGVYQTGGTLSGCLVKGNKTTYGQKYGGVYSTGGTIEDCCIVENIAYYAVGKQLYKTVGTVTGTTVAEGLHTIPSADVVKIADGVTVEDCVFQAPGIEGATELNASDYFGSGDCQIVASKAVGIAPLTVGFESKCEGATSWSWDFGGLGTSTVETPSFTFENPGRYTVTLTCGAKSGTLDILALPTKTYVGKNGSATFPYDTEAKATSDFQAAHDAVYADDTVHGTVEVLADTYTYTGSDVSGSFKPWMLVNKNATVEGVTGNRDEVVFDASRKIMTTFLMHPKAVLKDLTISNGRYNSSAAYGATLHMMNGCITNCVISKGFANYRGNATVRGGTVVDSVFSEGTLQQSGTDRPGGGLNIYGTCLITGCVFDKNFGGYGGGVYIEASGGVVSNCVIRGSTGGANGGAGVCVNGGLLTHSVVTNNSSQGSGGGVHLVSGTVRNCIIADNKSNSNGAPGIGFNKAGGGGVSMKGGTLENCTVAFNKSESTTRCDEIYQTGGTVQNCIFFGKDDNAACDVYKTGGTMKYSFARTAVAGEGNLDGDPTITSPSTGDFTLLYGSPAVDKGLTLTTVKDDIVGMARPQGDGYDMGAYEMDFSGRMVASFEADVTAGDGSVEVTLTATAVGGVEPYTYVWTIGDYTCETNQAAFRHTFGYGSHTISLVVRDANGNVSDSVERKDYVKVKTPIAYVSPEGTDVWPYDTWEKAATNVQDAVEAVSFTDDREGIVYVADGTYTKRAKDPTFVVNIQNPVWVIGTNADCKAVLSGARGLSISHARAKFLNFTITKCTGGGCGSGPATYQTDGVCSNIVVRDITANGSAGIQMEGGLFTDSKIDNCNGNNWCGGDRYGGAAIVSGGTLQRTVISRSLAGIGGGVTMLGASAVVRDCVITNCTAGNGYGGGAAVLKGTLENCVIVDCKQTGTSGSVYINNYTSTMDLGAAGVVAYGSSALVRNCLVTGCTSQGTRDFGTATYVGNGAKFVNVTVMSNKTNKAVNHDVYVYDGAATTVANTLAGSISNAVGVVDHCFVAATDGDPMLKNVGNGDFHVRSNSPAKNAGDNSFWEGVSEPVDLDGLPRIRFGQIDAGCYENQVAGFMLYLR